MSFYRLGLASSALAYRYDFRARLGSEVKGDLRHLGRSLPLHLKSGPGKAEWYIVSRLSKRLEIDGFYFNLFSVRCGT